MAIRTSIDIDRDAATRAAEILGTKTLRETVDVALREVVAGERRRRLAERVRTGTLPVPTAEELARLRAPKVPVGALSAPRRRRTS
jgi:Arc/MetJ family transcription regulator